LRWHIYRPSHVTGTRVSDAIKKAIKDNPALPNWNNLTQWCDAHEAAIANSLLAEGAAYNADLSNTLSNVNSWPNFTGRNARGYVVSNQIAAEQLGSIRSTRGSFQLDSTGL
jgi:hypothetical protein